MSKIKQPNSRHCFICGLENPVGLHLHIYETEPGVVETQYIAPDHFQGYPGVLHGGIVAAMIDEISGRAQMGSDPLNPRFMFTGKLEVKYRKNVPIGKMLKIIGKATKSKRNHRRSHGRAFTTQRPMSCWRKVRQYPSMCRMNSLTLRNWRNWAGRYIQINNQHCGL